MIHLSFKNKYIYITVQNKHKRNMYKYVKKQYQ